MESNISKLSWLLLFIFISSCNNNSTIKNKSVKEGVINYYQTIFTYKNGPTTDIKSFIEHNREEIINTLEISDVKEIPEKNIAIAFIRYSVGSTIVRSGLWFHKVNDSWTKTATNSLEYNYEAVGYEEKDENLKKLIEKRENWEKDNPNVWWLQYI